MTRESNCSSGSRPIFGSRGRPTHELGHTLAEGILIGFDRTRGSNLIIWYRTTPCDTCLSLRGHGNRACPTMPIILPNTPRGVHVQFPCIIIKKDQGKNDLLKLKTNMDDMEHSEIARGYLFLRSLFAQVMQSYMDCSATLFGLTPWMYRLRQGTRTDTIFYGIRLTLSSSLIIPEEHWGITDTIQYIQVSELKGHDMWVEDVGTKYIPIL